MSNARSRQPTSMTVDEFIAWPGDGKGGRYQLVDGEVRAMSPASATHGTVQMNIGGLIRGHLNRPGNPCRIVSEPAISVHIRTKHNLRVPDLGVSCAPDRPGALELPDPVLLIEILSPGNKDETWDNVWAHTTIPTVKEILVVHSSRVFAELLRRGPDGMWPKEPEEIGEAGTLHLTSIEYEGPLKAAYEKTYLG